MFLSQPAFDADSAARKNLDVSTVNFSSFLRVEAIRFDVGAGRGAQRLSTTNGEMRSFQNAWPQ
jgi:hypothetical protein